VVYGLLNGAIFIGIERPLALTQTSRSRRYLTLNISETVRDTHGYSGIHEVFSVTKHRAVFLRQLSFVSVVAVSLLCLKRQKLAFITRGSAIAERPRDASCHWTFC